MTHKSKWLFTLALYSKWYSHGALALCIGGVLLGPDQAMGKSPKNQNQEAVDDSVNPFDDADSAASSGKGGPGTEGPSEVLQKNPFQGGVQEGSQIDSDLGQGQSLDYNDSLGGQGGSLNNKKADFGEKDIEAAFSTKPKKVKSTQKKSKVTPKVKDTVAEKRLESQQKALAHEEAQKRRRMADQEKEAEEKLAASQRQALQLQENSVAQSGASYDTNSRDGLGGPKAQDQQGVLGRANSIQRGPGPGAVDDPRGGETGVREEGPSNAYGSQKTPNKDSGMNPEDFDRVPQWVSGQDALAIDGRLRKDDLLNEDQSLTLLKGSSAGHNSGLRGGFGGPALAGQLGDNPRGDYDDEADALRSSPSEDGANLAQGLFGDPFGPSVAMGDNQHLDDDSGPGSASEAGTSGGFENADLGSAAAGMGVLQRAKTVTRKGTTRLGITKVAGDRERDKKVLQVRADPKSYSLKLNKQPQSSLRLLALQVPMIRDTMGRHMVLDGGAAPGPSRGIGRSLEDSSRADAGLAGSFGQRSFWAKTEGADSWALGIWIGIALGLTGVGLTVLQRLYKGKTHRV